MCRYPLTEAATSSNDPDIVIGEEAHIVSSRETGPRYRPLPPGEVDHYNNLILLCPNHHTLIDKQERNYTESKLREIKGAHEQWTKERTQTDSEQPMRLRDAKPNTPTVLRLIDTPSALWGILQGSHALEYSKPDDVSDDQADTIAAFLQNMHDWMDVSSSLYGPAEDIRAERDVGRSLATLRDAGFVVAAGIRHQVLEGGVGPPSRWKTAVLFVRRIEDAATEEESAAQPGRSPA